MIFAFEVFACSRKDEKSVPGEWVAHFAQHLASALHHDRFGIALECVAEGIVGGDEEPGISAPLHNGIAGAVR